MNPFHLSLRVRDLMASVEFYGRLWGRAPVKLHADYAKFELEEPPLVLTLEKQDGKSPVLNHLGIRVAERNGLLDWATKLMERGLSVEHLENVECCYSEQSKIFLQDPDGVMFEVYTVNREKESASAQPATAEASAASWDHILPTPFPEKIPGKDFERISLRGTLNEAIDDTRAAEILRHTSEALRPGGEVILHLLVSDHEPQEAMPTLPEPASHVRRAPAERLVWELLRESGFVGLRAQRLSPHSVFQFKGCQFRELLIQGFKNLEAEKGEWTVEYTGPFPEVSLEDGTRLQRGERARVGASAAALLRSPAYRDSVVFINCENSACGEK